MSAQEVWFAQSSYSSTNSNDEKLTCTSVHDSHLRQNMQGLNQNIIHYVDMMRFYLNNPPTRPSTHTHTSDSLFRWYDVCVGFQRIAWVCSNSPSLTCWALFCPRCLQGFYRTPACSTGLELSWAALFNVVPASLWFKEAALNLKKHKPELSSNAYLKASADAFIMLHISFAPFVHVSAFPQRCAHIICVQPCHLHRSAHTHTKHIHISMLTWVCERQLGVNCTRV